MSDQEKNIQDETVAANSALTGGSSETSGNVQQEIPQLVADQATGVEPKIEAPVDPVEDEEYPPIPQEEIDRLTADIISAIKTVYDPEIPVDIYELGLIYQVDIQNDRSVHVEMTLTSPGCPVAGEMPGWVVDAVVGVDGVKKAKATLSFDPPWDMSMMSEEARFALNMF